MIRILLLTLLVAGCVPAREAGVPAPASQSEGLSLLGRELVPRALAPAVRERLEAELEAARAAHAADPADVEGVIWLGRRLAYLERYGEAIAVFTEGLRLHPDDARLYRHRGHRYITLRRFDEAAADLERAAALIAGTVDTVEPDGAPNPAGIPRSTLHSNVWYHLALAHYLRHDWQRALPAWRNAVESSSNDDMLVASADWLYMTLRRMGRSEEAAAVLTLVRPEMEILENHAYHRRLLMYRGEVAPEELLRAEGADELELATQGYAVGNWYLYNGRPAEARRIFERVVGGRYWAAFGFIAAEAELAAR